MRCAFDSARRICETRNCCQTENPSVSSTCRSGGIGRRAWFRSMYSQGCGGSSPLFGTKFFFPPEKNFPENIFLTTLLAGAACGRRTGRIGIACSRCALCAPRTVVALPLVAVRFGGDWMNCLCFTCKSIAFIGIDNIFLVYQFVIDSVTPPGGGIYFLANENLAKCLLVGYLRSSSDCWIMAWAGRCE